MERREKAERNRWCHERGEVSSWLLLAAGLALAAALAVPVLTTLVQDLAADVGSQANVTSLGPEAETGPGSTGPGSPGSIGLPAEVVEAQETAEARRQVQEILDRGGDTSVTEDEMNDISDLLQALTPEQRAQLFADLDADQIEALFNGIEYDGFFPWQGWNDDEKNDFYELIAPVANDPAALAAIRDALDAEDFLDFLVRVDTDHNNGAWPNGAAADELLRAHLPAEYLEDAIDDGRQAAGNLGILDDTNFEYVFDAYNDGRNPPLPDDQWERWNGFVDTEDRAWIKVSGANAGTPLHEAVHQYSDDALKDDVAQPLNEGVTEYFTRQVIAETDDPATAADEAADTLADRTNIYRRNTTFVEDLVAVVGEDVVADAYFNGDIDGLRDAYIDETGRSEADWDTMIDHINNRDSGGDRDPEWTEATALLSDKP